MVKHLPFNEFDIAGVKNAIERYEKAGLWPEMNDECKADGVVALRINDPTGRTGFVYFEVHKVARPGWFGDKAHWVVQLASQDVGTAIERRGCVAAPNQATVIHKAEIDIKYGFTSIATFDLAAEAY